MNDREINIDEEEAKQEREIAENLLCSGDSDKKEKRKENGSD